MTSNVKWAELPGTREEALDLLKTLNVSAIPVVRSESGEFVGMVSLRDLFEKPDEEQLAMLVEREVQTVSPDEELEACVRKIIEHGQRRIPVIQEGKLVGMITVKDIVYRVLCEREIDRPVSDFMRKNLMAIWEGTPLGAAVEIMSLAGLRALPVINERGELVGVVDDFDIIKVCEVETSSSMSQMRGKTEGDTWAWDTEDRIYITKKILRVPEKKISDVMTREAITVTRGASVTECARLMKKHKIEQLPVVTPEGRLTGMIYDIDLLKALL